ncbi:MAG: 3-oxoacyl-ACP reductase [Phenylobacterium zucineum]|nr:MAG: 3-oxoacyl-ACP reductase [Phenylobacterium zucineum]
MILSRSLKDSIALVTGAGSGMGAATAPVLAGEGAYVAVTDHNPAAAEVVAHDLRARGLSALAWGLDVTDTAQIKVVMADLTERFGGLDIVINNAGVSAFAAIDSSSYDAVWAKALAVMLTAHQQVIRAALPHLRKSAAPRIVNIASTEALGATSRDSPYAAAKAGVLGLTRALAVELGPEGITVNCICPGPILTNMTKNLPEADRAVFAKRRTALRRYGSAEEVAHMTVSLCLPAASYITGAIIPVDGGLMARNA